MKRNIFDENPNRSLLTTFARYGIIAILGWITLSTIMASPNMLNTTLALAIFWVIGIWIYRRRDFISGWAKSDKPFTEYVKESKATVPPNARGTITASVGKLPAVRQKTYDYSAADNEFLAPLSVSERRAFQNIAESFHNTEG